MRYFKKPNFRRFGQKVITVYKNRTPRTKKNNKMIMYAAIAVGAFLVFKKPILEKFPQLKPKP